jgi:hypothetical protein
MLRRLREQWWYTLLWLPLGVFLFLLAVWLWVTFQVVGGWTVRYDAAPKWGFFSAGTFIFAFLYLILLFPRKPARRARVALTALALAVFLLGVLYYANTRVITYEVRDVQGTPLEDIPIDIRHHASGVALTWFPGEQLLRTDKDGKANLRVFKSEECEASANELLGQTNGFGNSNYSGEMAFFTPIQATAQDAKWLFGEHAMVEHSYMLESKDGLLFVPQRCLVSPLNTDPGFIPIYLRRIDSTDLPPYFDQMVKSDSADPSVQQARMLSLGESVGSFNHLDELLAAASRDDSLQNSALWGLNLLATQISAITRHLPALSAADNTNQSNGTTEAQREADSQTLYIWLSSTQSPPPLSHPDRVAYIHHRMEDTTNRLIEALHPAMLKNKLAYPVLEELRELARPAAKYFPEVFAKGTPEAQEGALEQILFISPRAEDVAFLIRSKKPEWIERVSAMGMNSDADDLSADLAALQNLKSQEKDPENIAAFDRVIRSVSEDLARDRSNEEDKPISDIIPRYPVIDLGTNLLHPIKVTNSGYVLGRSNSTYYVWFEGTETVLQPKNAGDVLTVDDIDESGTAVGTESGPPGDKHRPVNLAKWEKGVDSPTLTPISPAELNARKSAHKNLVHDLNLPQPEGTPVTPVAVNAAVALLPAEEGPPAQPAQLVQATEVIGNGADGGYVWEMTRTVSLTKAFEAPTLLSNLLPGEPRVSRWKVISVASINDGGTIVGTAIYTPTGPDDPVAAGPHGVMLMPLAIVRERTIGSGDYGPIMDNGLDDNAALPIFASAPPGTPASEKSDPESDGQGVFYIEMPGSIATSITLKCGTNSIAVQATPVKGRPNLLRTGKLVLIEHGDPFRAPDIATLEVGSSPENRNPGVELQMYNRTVVH